MTPMPSFCRWLSLLALLLLLPVQAARADDALASAWVTGNQGRVQLVADPGQNGQLRLGLHFDLAPGWKIYWRSPGDAGLPPEVDWQGTNNVTIGATSWPVPGRFNYAGLETFGYEGEILLPMAATIGTPAKPATLHAAVDYLTCSDVCVPNHAVLTLGLPARLAGPGPWAALIDRFAARVPTAGSARGFGIDHAELTTEGPDGVLIATLGPVAAVKPDLLVEGANHLTFLAPIRSVVQGRVVLRAVAPKGASAIAAMVGQPLTLTLIDRGAAQPLAVSQDVVPTAAPPAEGNSLPGILLLAVLGGFILNFMPCVLPVLSIKLLALIGHSGRSRRELRLSFLASAAGILVSFLVMAGALIAARTAGLAVGWGLQFQQPVFLAALAAIVTLFACNLFGWFEIALPGAVSDLASGPGGPPTLKGSFAAGAFATVLATPCSAPFLGTAVGFALAGSAVQILLVFLCLGLGLALPYLLVAAVPGIGRFLPRPGRWMIGLRRVLGGLLVLTALWLLQVLQQQSGSPAALVVGLLAVLAGGAIYVRARRGRGGLGIAGTVLLLAMLLPPAILRAHPVAGDVAAGWTAFDEGAIPAAVADGHVVFVDVTARWCLTCQANERLVLDTDAVRARLTASGVIAMRADWTRPNAAIAAYLKGFGRYGIPFNVVYGPAAPAGLALPEVLTPALVQDALTRAKGRDGA